MTTEGGAWAPYHGLLLFFAAIMKHSTPLAALLNACIPRHDAAQYAGDSGADVAPVVRGLCAAHCYAMGEGTGRNTRSMFVPARHRVCLHAQKVTPTRTPRLLRL